MKENVHVFRDGCGNTQEQKSVMPGTCFKILQQKK